MAGWPEVCGPSATGPWLAATGPSESATGPSATGPSESATGPSVTAAYLRRSTISTCISTLPVINPVRRLGQCGSCEPEPSAGALAQGPTPGVRPQQDRFRAACREACPRRARLAGLLPVPVPGGPARGPDGSERAEDLHGRPARPTASVTAGGRRRFATEADSRAGGGGRAGPAAPLRRGLRRPMRPAGLGHPQRLPAPLGPSPRRPAPQRPTPGWQRRAPPSRRRAPRRRAPQQQPAPQRPASSDAGSPHSTTRAGRDRSAASCPALARQGRRPAASASTQRKTVPLPPRRGPGAGTRSGQRPQKGR